MGKTKGKVKEMKKLKTIKENWDRTTQSADKKPEKYIKPDGKVGIRMVPVKKEGAIKKKPMDENTEIVEAQDPEMEKVKQLVRIGLMNKKDMTKIVRALTLMKEGKPVPQKERKILFDMLSELIGMITGDDAMFNKARKAVKEEKDMNDMCCKHCGDEFGKPKSESCMYDAYDMAGRNWCSKKEYLSSQNMKNEALDTPKAMQSYRDKAKYSSDRAANSAVAKMLRSRSKDAFKSTDTSDELKTMDKRSKGLKMAARNAKKKTFKALRKEQVWVDEAAHDPKHVKMAIGIASDKKYKGGDMTGAVKSIEKIKKGLSDHPQVSAVLRRQNEETKRVAEKSEQLDEVSLDTAKNVFHQRKMQAFDAAHRGDPKLANKLAAKKNKTKAYIAKRESVEEDLDEISMDKAVSTYAARKSQAQAAAHQGSRDYAKKQMAKARKTKAYIDKRESVEEDTMATPEGRKKIAADAVAHHKAMVKKWGASHPATKDAEKAANHHMKQEEALERDGPKKPDIFGPKGSFGKAASANPNVQKYMAKKAAGNQARNKAMDPAAAKKGYGIGVTDIDKADKKAKVKGTSIMKRMASKGKNYKAGKTM